MAEEVGVLEIPQQSQVDAQAQCHQPLATRPACGARHDLRDEEVAARDHGQQKEVETARLIVEVVTEASHKQQSQRVGTVQRGVDDEKRCRQPQEDAAAEYHGRLRVVTQLPHNRAPGYVMKQIKNRCLVH